MKKLNNKGFSLVELIIVIAIMAILVGVVGTQVIPYLENSRKAKDLQIISSWNTAAMSAYSNAAAKVNANSSYEINITDSNVSISSNPSDTTGETSIKSYFLELTGIPATGYDFDKMDSKAGKGISNVKIEIDAAGKVTTTTTSAAGYFDVIEND